MTGGPERHRVAELIVTHADGERRGSGYRVTAESILTAAHVLDGAESVRIRFESDLPDERLATVVSWWAHADSDIAVVSIRPSLFEDPVEHALFGKIGAETAVLSVQAVGFPRWKMRSDGKSKYRDSHHLVGTLPTLSNWREGTLEITTDTPPGAVDAPWEGMSGAALWVGDRIIGVVTQNHPGDGPARLAAARLDLAMFQHADGDLWRLLPIPDHFYDLPSVVPAPFAELYHTAYSAQLWDIAPDGLLDRDDELARLVGFCAGAEPYAWWQAGPWAGKSALMSWFVLHLPAAVDIVSFFITSRFAGQSDSDAFTDALIEQLAALAGEAPQALLGASVRHGHLLRLLQVVADRCAETGRRLLLVVDGLDEDTSKTGGTDRPSIGSLLPRKLPLGVRVIVSSRPHPELPDDVPGNHPLRTVRPYQLTPSPHAHDIELAAKKELTRLLAGTEFHRDILGLITAAGGGLTQTDLEELTGQPPFEVLRLLNGIFGRTIGHRASSNTPPTCATETVYLFSHETLRETAEHQFGRTLTNYRDRLHQWADDFRNRGWPNDTPTYLLRGYPRMLAATKDIPRLVDLAIDTARQDRMLRLTWGDAAMLAELTVATSLIADQPAPDLGALLVLAIARDGLFKRNEHVPAELPAVWAKLGQPARAMAMATGIPDPVARASALRQLIPLVADDPDLAAEAINAAESAAHAIVDTWRVDEALGELSVTLAKVGRHERARGLADALETTLGERSNPATLGWLASLRMDLGDHDRATVFAEAAVRAVGSDTSVGGCRAVAVALVLTGARQRAEDLARQRTHPFEREIVHHGIAVALAKAGYHEHAEHFLGMLDRYAGKATCAVAIIIARSGDLGRAERLAKAISDSIFRAKALSAAAVELAARGDDEHAAHLAWQAESAAEPIHHDKFGHSQVWLDIVRAFAASGLDGAAESAMRRITNPRLQAQALGERASYYAGLPGHAIGLAIAAENAAREGIPSGPPAEAIASLAAALAGASDQDRARSLLRLSEPAQLIAEKHGYLHPDAVLLITRSPDDLPLTQVVQRLTTTRFWVDALPTLARISPQALRHACDTLLATEARSTRGTPSR